ncbi:MAG: peptidoglycan DD-metalloendopeptidase family protein, partial [Pseudomonadota bacterium]|nr:peptidoglycan DD-metalloendopeptidase family protein [Pseudomonadota bacterium]
ELAVTESQLDAQLQRDRAALSSTLAGLQALETQPPPAFAVHPDDALAAVQGAIALASIVPSMQSRAQALRNQLVELVAIRAHMDRQSGELVRAEQDAAAAQRSIEVALAEKAAAEADIRAAATREAEAIAELVRQARNLKDLAARLQKRSSRNPSSPPAERGDFARARGLVPLPVIGQVEKRFGQADINGQAVQGLAIAARPGAQITAPYDGRILYSGAFRQYGGIVILGIEGNYQMILAGMEAPHSYVGQEVLTGEPLGNLPQGSGSLERSRLYLELRYNGRPIDPAPWIKNEKRSG